jgi:hypothetical protein
MPRAAPSTQPLPPSPHVQRTAGNWGAKHGGRLVADPQPAADEQRHDQQLRNDQQPPLHQHQPVGEPLGLGHVQVCLVVGHVGEGERRMAVGAQRPVAVVVHPPGPAQHADVEVEQRSRTAGVNRIAKNVITVTTKKASQRKVSTTRCGMSSNHLISHSPRETDTSCAASTRTGYGVRFSVTVAPRAARARAGGEAPGEAPVRRGHGIGVRRVAGPADQQGAQGPRARTGTTKAPGLGPRR